MPREPHNWYMNPMERLMLTEWLSQFNGHVILNMDILPSLDLYGLKWNYVTKRLSYMSQSAEIVTYSPQYFHDVLHAHGGRGHVDLEFPAGVWALDVASAILTIAGLSPDPTVAIPSRKVRYSTILSLLRPIGDVKEASGLVGEIRA